MNCPYCQNEMEQGKVNTTASGLSCVQQVFLTEEEANKGLFEMIKDAARDIRTGIFHDYGRNLPESEVAYRCEQCGKVFAEYDIQPTDQ